VRQFVYTVKLPRQRQVVLIKELQFDRYKHLVKNILNGNDEVITKAFDCLIDDLCEENYIEYTFLDKLIILLTIRSVCISPVLELTVNCPETNQQFNTNVKITDIIDKLQNLNLPDEVYKTVKHYNNGDLIVEIGMPNTLNLKEEDLSITNTTIQKITLNNNDVTNIKEQIIEHFPITVLKDIRDYIDFFSDSFYNLSLLSLQSPFAKVDNMVTVPLNLFSNSIIEFLKICFKRSLLSFYELEYFLNHKLNIDYDLIKVATPAELNIYINFFKEEKAEEEKRERKKNLNLPQ